MSGFFSSSAIHQPAPAGTVPRCGVCGYFKSCQSPKLPLQGRGGRGVLIVGEAPGKEDDLEGRFFVGKAGQFLRGALLSLGMDMDRDCWTTSALICHPPKGASPSNDHVRYCQPNLQAVLARVKPRVVVTLGRLALVSVLGSIWKDISELERWVGWKIPLPEFWLCPLFSPAYVQMMDRPTLDRLFEDQLAAAFAAAGESRPAPRNWTGDVEVLLDDAAVEAALEQIDRAMGWAAVDYESNCIKPEWPKARLYSCAVSNGERTISYPWTARTKAATGRFLHSSNTRKIASNLKMEERWTRHEFGYGVRRWGWDTMLAAHVLDNRPGICSLKFQALVKLGVPPYNKHIEPYLESDKGPYNRIHEIDLRQLLLYGGMDSLLEHALMKVQRTEMEAPLE